MTHIQNVDLLTYNGIKDEALTFIILKDDRGMREGDTLIFQRDGEEQELTTSIIWPVLSHTGLKSGYCAVGFTLQKVKTSA